jgi:hypothetical protein
MTPGSTVMIGRDASGDEEDRPLSLEIIEPKKPKLPEPEKVGVGAKKGEGEGSDDDGEHPGAPHDSDS